MRALLQRVREAKVVIDGNVNGAIEKGLLVLLGIENDDSKEDIDWLVKKILQMRIFNDVEGKMNLALSDVGGNVLVISQFTLHAGTKKGNRPSFIKAAKPDVAIPLYEAFLEQMTVQSGKEIQRGIFGADMKVHLVNDGPVTIWIDSKNKE